MRVKISATDYDIDKLIYGKSYFMSYAGATFGEEFIFTRKNRIELCVYEYNIKGELYKESSRWVSRKELKKIINSGAIHWMGQF